MTLPLSPVPMCWLNEHDYACLHNDLHVRGGWPTPLWLMQINACATRLRIKLNGVAWRVESPEKVPGYC